MASTAGGEAILNPPYRCGGGPLPDSVSLPAPTRRPDHAGNRARSRAAASRSGSRPPSGYAPLANGAIVAGRFRPDGRCRPARSAPESGTPPRRAPRDLRTRAATIGTCS
ncbi:hypothetical protein DI270_035760 [Microbispora triticiradicis]|uniref:Uncharacterized protein n=1 Tax=Microbispora triticiradicis TaxID=2200763 RepID=A0ABX9L8Y3_9ACTN|nr:hypothetical protein DI270_035760 [Microbispora triticiradicis]GLW21192.1 hypothetical protein Mame01_12350 [Microbispora amethystogenes]